MTPAPPLIPWSILGWVVLYSSITGIGLVGIFSIGIYALSGTRTQQRGSAKSVLSYVLLFACGAAIVSVLAWGLYLVMHKS